MECATLLLAVTPSVDVARAAGEPAAVRSHAAGILDGARHLATEPDHLLAVVALALLCGAAAPRARLAAGCALAGAMTAGALTGDLIPAVPVVETVNVASIAIVGALVVARPRFPLGALAAITLTFGWCHGYANVLDRAGHAPPLPYVIGVVVAASAVFGAFCILAGAARVPWQRIAVRAAGSWICAIGLIALAFRLVRA